MKCSKCEFYKDDTCTKAASSLSQIEDISCLLRIQIILLRDIFDSLQDYDDEEGEGWKGGHN